MAFAISENVIAPARYRADGHIGLVPTKGGFGTPTILVNGQRYEGSLTDSQAFQTFVATAYQAAGGDTGATPTPTPTPAG